MKGNRMRLLTNKQIEGMLQIFTQKEIAEIFECATSVVSMEITGRNIFSAKESNKTMHDGVPIYKTKGAWMQSKERKYFNDKKQTRL
jgi:hypothetical protein